MIEVVSNSSSHTPLIGQCFSDVLCVCIENTHSDCFVVCSNSLYLLLFDFHVILQVVSSKYFVLVCCIFLDYQSMHHQIYLIQYKQNIRLSVFLILLIISYRCNLINSQVNDIYFYFSLFLVSTVQPVVAHNKNCVSPLLCLCLILK